MKRLLTFCILTLVFAVLPQMALASCPDQAVCELYWSPNNSGDPGQKRVGIIDTPTCWKIGHQCRPWHCGGDSTNSDHWINRCVSTYGVTHNANHRNEKICVIFPSVKTSLHGRELLTKDYCRDLN